MRNLYVVPTNSLQRDRILPGRHVAVWLKTHSICSNHKSYSIRVRESGENIAQCSTADECSMIATRACAYRICHVFVYFLNKVLFIHRKFTKASSRECALFFACCHRRHRRRHHQRSNQSTSVYFGLQEKKRHKAAKAFGSIDAARNQETIDNNKIYNLIMKGTLFRVNISQRKVGRAIAQQIQCYVMSHEHEHVDVVFVDLRSNICAVAFGVFLSSVFKKI